MQINTPSHLPMIISVLGHNFNSSSVVKTSSTL
uniref:Uncharacterized protein n=1 Tax=Anguilla anguilla TaxID=7936 RepID=A0A0E9VAU0_ANGAN